MNVPDLITINPDLVTLGIVTCMIWLFIRALRSENRSGSASYLVSLGIFGTFLGITIALFGFDPEQIQASVPELIGGMKVAFISSAVGIAFSLILKFPSLGSSGAGSAEAKTADDIFLVMVEQKKQLESLHSALVGEADSTLLTQLQLIRTEGRDQADMIRSSLDDFARTLAENNSAAFIEALEGAVREFNDKISEQFGENFAQLNEAVGRLLDWQEHYREQLKTTIELFADIGRQLKQASSEISDVAQQTQSLARVSEQQAEWLQAQKTAQIELEARLEAFSDLAETARSAFPLINKNLEDITKGFGDSVETMLGSMTEVVGRVEGSAETLSEQVDSSLMGMRDQVLESNELSQGAIRKSIEELDQALGDALNRALESNAHSQRAIQESIEEAFPLISKNLEDITKGVGDSVETMLGSMTEVVGRVEGSAETLSEQVDSSLAGMKDQVLESNARSQSAIQDSIEELDQALGDALTKSLESLGGELASLSRQFVDDYTPLTDNLREVVRIAEGIEA